MFVTMRKIGKSFLYFLSFASFYVLTPLLHQHETEQRYKIANKRSANLKIAFDAARMAIAFFDGAL